MNKKCNNMLTKNISNKNYEIQINLTFEEKRLINNYSNKTQYKTTEDDKF